jgi:hypothetical protein
VSVELLCGINGFFIRDEVSFDQLVGGPQISFVSYSSGGDEMLKWFVFSPVR